MNVDLSTIFNMSLINSTFRASTPIIYAALCAAITQQANILNVGIEGIMLIGSFTAVTFSYITGSWVIGVLAAMIAGCLISGLIGIGHIKFNADITAIGMGVNLFALAITRLLLQVLYGVNGSFASPYIKAIPRISIGFFSKIPVLGSILNNLTITEWLLLPTIILLYFVIYKTPYGLHLRAVGAFPEAAKTAGINTTRKKYESLLIGGLVGGLAGAHLSLGYSAQFVNNMTNNRGFMGIAAMFFGGANPIHTSLGCLLFGFADSIGARLQSYGLPAQFVLMLPYIVTILVLTISVYAKIKNDKRKESSLVKREV